MIEPSDAFPVALAEADMRIPPQLRPLFTMYLSRIEQALPGWLRGFYVVGSLALDDFSPRYSDIDFIAVLDRAATDEGLRCLKEIHLYRSRILRMLEAVAFLKEVIGICNSTRGGGPSSQLTCVLGCLACQR